MSTEFESGPTSSNQVAMKEYSVTIDEVVEVLNDDIDEKTFFQGLFDAVISYVEQHQALAGVTISHKEYEHAQEETSEDSEVSLGG